MAWGFGLASLFALMAGACTPGPDTGGEQSCPPCECQCNGADAETSDGVASSDVSRVPPSSEADAQVADSAGPIEAKDPSDPNHHNDPNDPSDPSDPNDPSGNPVGSSDPLRPGLARAPDGRDISEIVGDATRKMMHDDGKGCLADLDLVRRLDPKMDPRMEATRGQCEMLIGRCQTGKERVAKWYETETNMHPERAMITAESLASMRCRGGDASDRDRLLRAYFELSQGAYVEPFAPSRCEEHLATARALIPKVKPRDVDDGQISGGAQALFHTASQCFAKAGDCKRSWAVYRDLFPPESLKQIADAATRERVVRDAFDTSVERCKGKI